VSTRLVNDKLSSATGLIIDGYLECTMAHHKQHLTVTEYAQVHGNVNANTVLVFGQLVGNIFSDGTVSLASGSDVRGDIHCACLQIEEGAKFIGNVEMGDGNRRAGGAETV
jgi:cytoskeletal protein CcmA (bactofilin family)